MTREGIDQLQHLTQANSDLARGEVPIIDDDRIELEAG